MSRESPLNDKAVDRYAQTIWDYMHMDHVLEKADVILALGSHDVRVAQWAAELYLQGWAPLILFSGNEGAGRQISGFAGTPEAEHFAQIAIKLGVPEAAILKEIRSTNTGENILYSAELLDHRGMKPDKIIVIQKPYMERRTYATLKAQWPAPQPEFILTSPPLSYEEYTHDSMYPKEYTINVMVGDLQRIREYPKKGYQIEQEIPDDVWAAYEKLVAAGYTRHLLG